jgi:hypothetical protein
MRPQETPGTSQRIRDETPPEPLPDGRHEEILGITILMFIQGILKGEVSLYH